MFLSLPSIRWWWSIWSRWSGSFSFLLFASSRFRSRSSSSSTVIFSFLFLFSWVAFWRSQVQFGVGGIHIILKYAVAESWIRIFAEMFMCQQHTYLLSIVMQRGLICWKWNIFKICFFSEQKLGSLIIPTTIYIKMKINLTE